MPYKHVLLLSTLVCPDVSHWDPFVDVRVLDMYVAVTLEYVFSVGASRRLFRSADGDTE